jgi:hypothetical protein
MRRSCQGGRGHRNDRLEGLYAHAKISRRERCSEDLSGCRGTQRNRRARCIAQIRHREGDQVAQGAQENTHVAKVANNPYR